MIFLPLFLPIFKTMIYYNQKNLGYWRPWNEKLNLAHIGNIAEVYIFYLSKSFVASLLKGEESENLPFIYVTLEDDKPLRFFIKHLQDNRGIRLKFTPFTDGDYRIVLRLIAEKEKVSLT